MTPEIITYLICLLTFAYLAVTVFTFVKNRRTGDGYRLRIFYVLAAALVFCEPVVEGRIKTETSQ